MLRSTKQTTITPLFFETAAWNTQQRVCGIDEVGRGCLAGPVVTAAVILPPHTHELFLKDSKEMSARARDNAYDWITQNCSYALGIASAEMVDEINIYQTTLWAMKKAFTHLYATTHQPQLLKYVVVDAMPLTLPAHSLHAGLEIHHFNYGESLSPSIAAASIVAKVTRDRLMEKINRHFPAYEMGKHKGYATKVHCDALKATGASIIHRMSFIDHMIPIIAQAEQHNPSQQLTLFPQAHCDILTTP